MGFVRWCRCPAGSQSPSRFSCSQSQTAVQKWVFRGEENLPLLVNNKFPSQMTVAPLIDDFPRLVPCTQGVSQQQLGRRFGPATVASMLATQFCMMSLALPHLLRDCAQDLANQVRWSRSYQDACRAHKAEEGNFLSVAAAEWFSGLPLQWTSIEGEVCKQTFVKMFPRATSKARFDFFYHNRTCNFPLADAGRKDATDQFVQRLWRAGVGPFRVGASLSLIGGVICVAVCFALCTVLLLLWLSKKSKVIITINKFFVYIRHLQIFDDHVYILFELTSQESGSMSLRAFWVGPT